MTAEKPLVDYLLDRDWLAALPKGSLGERYYNFTKVEQITADGLTDASIEGRDEEREMSAAQIKYHERMRDAHDLWHVTTGYGRDPLGELCLLAVTWRQLGNLGILVIIAAGFMVTRKEAPELGIGLALREAFRLGKAAKGLPGRIGKSCWPCLWKMSAANWALKRRWLIAKSLTRRPTCKLPDIWRPNNADALRHPQLRYGQKGARGLADKGYEVAFHDFRKDGLSAEPGKGVAEPCADGQTVE